MQSRLFRIILLLQRLKSTKVFCRNMEMLKSKRAVLDSMREEIAKLCEDVESISTSEERTAETHQRMRSLNDQLQVKQKKREDVHREVELLNMNVVTLEAQQRERNQPRNKQKSRGAPNTVNTSGTYNTHIHMYSYTCMLFLRRNVSQPLMTPPSM